MSNSISQEAARQILAQIFQAGAGISLGGTLYCSLHTGDPTDLPIDGQRSLEVTYAGYARVGIVRSTGGWNLTSAEPCVVSPVNTILFPAPGATNGETATHWSIGTVNTGGQGFILFSGAITPSIVITNAVPPALSVLSTVTLT